MGDCIVVKQADVLALGCLQQFFYQVITACGKAQVGFAAVEANLGVGQGGQLNLQLADVVWLGCVVEHFDPCRRLGARAQRGNAAQGLLGGVVVDHGHARGLASTRVRAKAGEVGLDQGEHAGVELGCWAMPGDVGELWLGG